MPAPKLRGRTDKRKQLANVRVRGRQIQAMAVPRGSDVARAAGSLVRGRLPNGSLLSTLVRSLAGGGRSRGGSWAPPRSAAPVTPLAKISGEVARTTSGYTPLHSSRPNTRLMGVNRRGKGPFVSTVRLNPSMVTDRRGNTPVETRAAWDGRRRVGQMFPNLVPVPPLQRVNPTSVPRVTMSAAARAGEARKWAPRAGIPGVMNRTGQSRKRLTMR